MTQTTNKPEESKTQRSSQYGQPNRALNPLNPQLKFQPSQRCHKNLNIQHHETQEPKRLYVGSLNTDISNEGLTEATTRGIL